jgi:nuclear GTP-binding protein
MPKTRVDKKLGPPTKNRKTPKDRPDLRKGRDIRRLNMYKNRIKRNEKGEITKGSVLEPEDKVDAWRMKRIAPDRRWFGNTRVIGQKVLEKFREELQAKYHDPYSVVIKQAKLPLTLLEIKDHDESSIKKQLDWTGTFGKKKTRKHPKLSQYDYHAMLDNAKDREINYERNGHKDRQTNAAKMEQFLNPAARPDHEVFRKGQSARIWNELYKVIDSSDVVIQVLDARDPMGTRSKTLEKYLRAEKKYKHLVFVLNKCDLIPTWATSRWVALLSREFPTIAFHASITNPFGKGNLINLIRQFAKLHKAVNGDIISVGLVGYPNVGKSSVINTLRGKKVCSVAPIPGETKVWQYIKLSRGVMLIDCPGVIHQSDDANDTHQAVLKGVVRVERLANEEKADFVETVLKLVDRTKIADTYGIQEWYDHLDFLDQLALKRGKLLRGGVPDRDSVARTVLYDWQRAKIPWFTAPPFESEADEAEHRTLPKKQHLKIITDCQDAAMKECEQRQQAAEADATKASCILAGDLVDEEETGAPTDPRKADGAEGASGAPRPRKARRSKGQKRPRAEGEEEAAIGWDDLM